MKVLALDCSNQLGSVALYNDGELTSLECENTKRHAEVMLPLVEEVLANSSIALSQLDALACCRGPGSFTGVRISCSIAKGLAHACDLPIRMVSSLAAIAQQVENNQGQSRVLSIIDARMREVYWACYQSGVLLSEERVSALEQVEDFINNDKALIIAGVGLSEHAQIEQWNIPVVAASVHAESIAKLATEVEGQSAQQAMPSYIRDNVIQ